MKNAKTGRIMFMNMIKLNCYSAQVESIFAKDIKDSNAIHCEIVHVLSKRNYWPVVYIDRKPNNIENVQGTLQNQTLTLNWIRRQILQAVRNRQIRVSVRNSID